MKRFGIPLVFGLLGATVLVALGLWQLERLAWKEGVLAEIDARIGALPVAIPEVPQPETDRYLPVAVSGQSTGDALYALVSTKERGAGYRLLSGFETDDGRRVILDEGFLPVAGVETKDAPPPIRMMVRGNLHWPEETDSFTPAPDLEEGLVFARDVPVLAQALGTEPVLVVARSIESEGAARATPMPVTTAGIPNNHLGYAVQWFGLAAVWLGMTAFLIWRIQRRDV
ncbi:SURF1 family protein [Alphaproteobacteria bacterium GH1-50]|uniref:SURF1-like protein n=1 Tax=Kangsaoukella pontilimi TaxID=2691042 RepID=A0A7C9IHP2_9RHOB|nr:SURF1 family protein [Kangsaoukella pontilimi]MXQ08767.1 SURF1 family protein [Kangsaoukella pontilimi]